MHGVLTTFIYMYYTMINIKSQNNQLFTIKKCLLLKKFFYDIVLKENERILINIRKKVKMQTKAEKKTNKAEGFMKSVLVLMISQVFIKLLGFVYRVYLTNREGFGDEGNAIYSGGYLIYALLLTISSIGVPNAISKLVSERVAIRR